jgi:hypothetical protein
VESEIAHLLLFVGFLSLLPRPRLQLYRDAFFLVLTLLVSAAFRIGRILKPFFDALKVDTQTKAISGIIAVSTLAPRAGKYVLARRLGVSRIRESFDAKVGNEMMQFRRDLRRMYVRNAEVKKDSPDKGELLADIKRTQSKIQRRHTIGEVLIGVVVGVLAILVGTVSFLYGVALLLSLYLLIFPLSMLLRDVVVDMLAFSAEMVDVEAEEPLYPQRTAVLGFMQGWNRMLLRNERIVHKIILVSFARDEFILGYERGQELMEQVIAGEKELDEALDDLVYEELGEETFEGRWVRRVLNRWFGV